MSEEAEEHTHDLEESDSEESESEESESESEPDTSTPRKPSKKSGTEVGDANEEFQGNLGF